MATPADGELKQDRPGQPPLIEIFHVPNTDAGWDAVLQLFGRESKVPATRPRKSDLPLKRCLEVARGHGAISIVVENYYVDLDYRSEYSAFYSKAFAPHGDTTQRLHFFTADVELTALIDEGARFQESYVGYVVLRPTVAALVGRTMLKPPTAAVRTAVSEKVNLLGHEFSITAVPFMQQDSRVDTCAHAALWVCHYSAFRAHRGVGRVAIAAFNQAVNPGLGLGRNTPSAGLTLHQMSDLVGALGLPPLYYDCESLSTDDRPQMWPARSNTRAARVSRVCCRYLNSGLPCIAVMRQVRTGTAERVAPKERWESGALHAVVACGYYRDDKDDQKVVFIIHDDRLGPYLSISNIDDSYHEPTGEHSHWAHLVAPVPEKLWLSPEAAEHAGSLHLLTAALSAVRGEHLPRPVPEAAVVVDLHKQGDLTARTYAVPSNEYKRDFRRRCDDHVVRAAIGETRMPRYVWVVEAVHRQHRRDGLDSVYAEVVLDATSDEHSPIVLATRLPGIVTLRTPSTASESRYTAAAAPLPSGSRWLERLMNPASNTHDHAGVVDP